MGQIRKTTNKNSVQNPVKILPTRKVEKKNDKVYYYFETPGDSAKTRFVYASEFGNYNGVWMSIVQKEQGEPYQMMNIYGQLSDQEFKNLALKQMFFGSGKKITFNGREITPKRFKDDEGYYFIFPDATQTKRFEWATEFDDEHWKDASLVKEEKFGSYRVLNTKGELSENHYSGKLNVIKLIMSKLINFSESALITETQVKKNMASQVQQPEWLLCQDEFHGEDEFKPYYFKNTKGEILAGKRFAYAEPFSDGFALVSEDGTPNARNATYFINEQGKMSSPFWKGSSYQNGFALVITSYNMFKIADKQGNFSESFYSVRRDENGIYNNGYAVVQTEWGVYRLRNINGELSEKTFRHELDAVDSISSGEAKDLKFISSKDRKETTQQPKENVKRLEIYSMQSMGPNAKSVLNLNKYFAYELSIYDLTPEEILENLEKIQQFEEMNYQMALEQCKYKQSMESLYQDYMALAEYIKQTAYEALTKAKRKVKEDAVRDEFQEKSLF